jgi:nicotinamide mononucleotide transporter
VSKALDVVVGWFALTSRWELIAVVLALGYLLLAVKRNLWCWLCALVSSAIYVALMFQARLYMQAALNVFYVAMAIYGFYEWQRGRNEEGVVAVLRWPLWAHAVALVTVAVASAINGWVLQEHVDSASPYLDSFVTWGSVVTTWMVARRVIENWLYWIVVDGVAAYVYFSQNLRATGILFLIYIVIVIQGYRVWRRESVQGGYGIVGR